MDSRCLRDLDHLGNRNRRPRAARSGRLYIGFRGDLNPVDTSNPSSNPRGPTRADFAYEILESRDSMIPHGIRDSTRDS